MNYPVKLPLLKCHSGSRKMQPGVPPSKLQLLYLQRLGRADGRRVVLVPELLLRLPPEVVFFAFGPAVALPDLVGTVLDFLVGRMGHHVTSLIPVRRRFIVHGRRATMAWEQWPTTGRVPSMKPPFGR